MLTLAPACQVQQDHRARGGGEQQQEAILLVLPLTVSFLNVLMPHVYNVLAMWEKQDSPVVQVYVAIGRWAGGDWGGGSILHPTCGWG